MNCEDLKLPALLATACKAGGIEAVKRLSEGFGGKLMYIPPREACPDNHLLVQVGGRAVADALCNVYGGTPVEFPRGEAVLNLYLAAAMIEEGLSNNQIAARLSITWRHARRLRKRLKGKDPVARALASTKVPFKKVGQQIDLEEWLQVGAKKAKR